MAAPATLGFKLHTGWAALVAIAGRPGKLEVLLRRRVELLPAGDSVPRFVYHKAAELPLAQATDLIQHAKDSSERTAQIAINDASQHLQSLGFTVQCAGIPAGSRQVPDELSAILRAHPMIHTAEGILFQNAVASACEVCKLRVVSTREREVWFNAAEAWGAKEANLRKEVDGLRESTGAPWGSDQKTATAVALLALRSSK